MAKLLTDETALQLTEALLKNDKAIIEHFDKKIPDTGDLATKEYVSSEIAKAALSGGEVSLDAYYTKTETNNLLDNKADKKDIPSVAGLASTEYVDNAVSNVSVDLTGYATEEYVEEYVNEVLKDVDVDVDINLENYYTKNETYSKSEVDAAIQNVQGTGGNVDLTDYVKAETMNTALAGKANTVHTHEQYLTEHQNLDAYALKNEIPSLDGYAKTEDIPDVYDDTELTEKIGDVETALTNKADKTELHVHTNKNVIDGITSEKIASWDAKATEAFVTNAIANAQLGSDGEIDLSGYVTQDDLAEYVKSEDLPDSYDDAELRHRIQKIESDYVTSADITNIEHPFTEDHESRYDYTYDMTMDLIGRAHQLTEKTQELEVKAHNHNNVDVLEKISESTTGTLLFNGNEIQGGASGDVTISTDDNNAIVTGADNGLFVEDKTTEIETLTGRVDEIKKYQKYLNTDLDSCYMPLETVYTPVLNEYIPFTKVSGSMKVNNGRVVVKPGQRVQIDVTIGYGESSSSTYANIVYMIKDYTNDYKISYISPTISTEYEFPDSAICQYTNDTDVDCEIGVQVQLIRQADTLFPYRTAMTVQEIGRQTIIDPIEHANEKYGIEDTPVGHIISHMGMVAPKHYLICDGTEYNIMDYPYLAQHFIDQFGSVNYFGGDGTTTFAVPDLRGEFLRGTGTALRNTGSGAEVGVHQDATCSPIMGINTAQKSMVGYGNSSQTGDLVMGNPDKRIKIGTISKLSLPATMGSTSSIDNLYTSRPTNTSVLYCIKYEPTYYIQNYATKFQETTLWEGSSIVDCSTEGTSTIDISFNLADNINNYDRIEIRYGGYKQSDGVMRCATFKQLIPSEITIGDTAGDISLVLQYNYTFVAYGLFTDEQTLTFNRVHTENVTNAGLDALKIYQIIGLKPAKPVYDVAINCDNDYSTEERVIGRWVDGKPLYQKTIMTDITITAQSQNIEITEDSSGWDTVMIDNQHTILYKSDALSATYTIPSLNGTDSGHNISVSFTKGNPSIVCFRTGEDAIGNSMALKCITLQYTKTTDSVETTTRKSYSLDETLTGDTWIDGKPIYRKVIKCTAPSNVKANTAVYSVTDNIETVTKLDGLLCYGGSSSGSIPVNYNSNSSFIATYYRNDTQKIHMTVSNTMHASQPTTIILEYTKSE